MRDGWNMLPAGGLVDQRRHPRRPAATEDPSVMNSIIYLIGLIVVVVAILSFLGLG